MILPFGILVLIDQITKALFADRDFLLYGIHLHPINNYGLPFGLNFGSGWNFIVLLFVYLIAGWMIYRIRLVGKWSYLGKQVFLAGAASNLIDRLLLGYVRDFIDLGWGFVFNLADMFIVAGLVIVLFGVGKKDSTVENLQRTIET